MPPPLAVQPGSAFFDALTDAVLLVDDAWRVTHVNHAASRVLESPPAWGVSLWSSYPALAQTSAASLLRDAMASRTPARLERLELGSELYREASAFPTAQGGLALLLPSADRGGRPRPPGSPREAAMASREQLYQLFMQLPALVSLTRGPSHVFELVNTRSQQLLGARDVIGLRVADALPELEQQGFVALLDEVYRTGVPFVRDEMPAKFDVGGHFEERFFNVVYQAYREADGSITGVLSCSTDVTEQVRSRQRVEELATELSRRESLLRTLTNNTDSALFFMDDRQKCTFMNAAAEAMTGHTLESVLAKGQPLHDIIHHLHPDGRPYPMAECPIDRALPQRAREKGEDTFVHADGSFYPVAFTASPIVVAGEPIGTVIEVRNTTAERQREQERERLLDSERAARELVERHSAALAQTNAELDQFAYVASHDLKAPLRGIANLSQWIEEDLAHVLSGETRENMDLLRGRVNRLEALINGILDYSRAGRVRSAPEATDVGTLLRDAIELLAPPSGARIELRGQMPMLHVERVPFQQVFLNLIGNALKYANRPDPVIVVSVREEGPCYHFAVADNGPGIAPEYFERIWGIFQTLEARDDVEGTGIGLSVVKKIVETRGGRTWVESEPDAGATFHVLWPKHWTGDAS